MMFQLINLKKCSDIINNDELKIKNKSIVKADVVFFISSKSPKLNDTCINI